MPVAALLDAGVVGGAEPGEQRQLLAAQAGDPPPSAVDDAGRGGVYFLAAAAQEGTELVVVGCHPDRLYRRPPEADPARATLTGVWHVRGPAGGMKACRTKHTNRRCG